MKELSLNILDIAKNSVAAGASQVDILCREAGDTLVLRIQDNGRGMSRELADRAADPFTTTRQTRKVGMGLPLLKMLAEQCGGRMVIASQPGVGTDVEATFRRDSIDLPPLGDMAGTMVTLIQGSPEIDFTFTHQLEQGEYRLSTGEMREIMEDVSLAEPEVLQWVREYVSENERELYLPRLSKNAEVF